MTSGYRVVLGVPNSNPLDPRYECLKEVSISVSALRAWWCCHGTAHMFVFRSF